MFTLKSYQQRALETLGDFFEDAQQSGDIAASFKRSLKAQGFDDSVVPFYRDYQFDNVPYICVRIPTGGGKTILAANCAGLVGKKYLQQDYPIVLWLVPSTAIRTQTVEALKKPEHPYRQQLDGAFNHRVKVLDVDEVDQLCPQDIDGKTIVVVSTIQNLRVTDTSGRKVYAYSENFEPHFNKLDQSHPNFNQLEKVTEDDLKENGLTQADIGKVKYSFANLLAMHQPLVIVDEAHNARSKLSLDMLRRVHPAAIIEFTATPDLSKNSASNVIFHVSASELKAEQMIKLPIMLAEEPQGWQQSVGDAVLNQKRLETAAQKDPDYIRPIALFQAEPKNGTVTVEVLKRYLVDDLDIEEDTIAIATGNQRELDGIDLFSPSCRIRYIITIEALKEGWDCSFAYVFCSVKQVSSSKDAEQLLGRVLRMPYARRRVIEDLNRAYAHLSTSTFRQAADELKDKLIAMGFEELDIAEYVRQFDQPQGSDLFGEYEGAAPRLDPRPSELVLELPTMPDLAKLDESERENLTATETEDGVVVRVRGEVSEKTQKVIAASCDKAAVKKSVQQNIRIHNHQIKLAKSPAQKGESFASMPMLCTHIYDDLELVESSSILDITEWNLLDHPAKLPKFRLHESSDMFEFDLDGDSVVYRVAEERASYNLNDTLFDLSSNDLVRFLDRELRQPEVPQGTLLQFIERVVQDLLSRPNFNLTSLIRNKYPLARAINDLIERYKRDAQKDSYQKVLFSADAKIELSAEFNYEFLPDVYPAKPPYYSGRFQFEKHYYGANRIEKLEEKGEEYECATVLDSLKEVKHWIRNLDKRGFWLPLAHGKFYPDFIAELHDGRVFIVEYKGAHLSTADDARAKRLIGETWAKHSGGKGIFWMARSKKDDDFGQSVRDQLLDAIDNL